MKRVRKVVCYLVRGNELLVFRQPRFPEAGLQVPAGTIEAGESAGAAAMREAREETGLAQLRLLKELGRYDFDMSHWKPEVHERHVFAVEVMVSPGTKWTHVAEGDIDFEFSWHALDAGDPNLIADQGRFLGDLRRLIGQSFSLELQAGPGPNNN